MTKTLNKDNFSYLHDEYEGCNFCAQKYKGYSIFEHSDSSGIDIELFPKRMDELCIVVAVKFALTFFEARHPKLIKDQGIPDDLKSYAGSSGDTSLTVVPGTHHLIIVFRPWFSFL